MSDFMLLGILRMPIEADDGIVAFTQFRSAARSAADRIEQLTAERDRLRAALIEERTETLWNAYGTGMERDGRWRHMCMSDGEWLEFECGLDNSQPDHPADVVKAAIPFAAERFVAALVALKGQQ